MSRNIFAIFYANRKRDYKLSEVKMFTFFYLIRAAILVAPLLLVGPGRGAEPDAGGFKSIEEGQVFFIPEIGALLIQEGEIFKLEGVMPPETRIEEYRQIDLADGDRIIMINGKKLKSVEQVKDIYEELATGDEIAFGIMRDGNMLIASFANADEKDLPKRKFMIVSKDELGDMEGISADSGAGMKVIRFGGDDEAMTIIHEAGLILEEKEHGLYFKEVLPFAPQQVEKLGLHEDDRLISIGGTEIENGDDLADAYSRQEQGDEIELVFDTGDGKKSCNIKKESEQDMKTTRMIKRK